MSVVFGEITFRSFETWQPKEYMEKKQKGGFNKVEFFTAHLDTNGDLITSLKSHVCWKFWIEIAVIAVICTYPQEHRSCKPKISHHIHRFDHKIEIHLGGFLERKR